MAEHPDVARFQRALEARGGGDPSTGDASLLADLFADDVVWDGAAKGKAEVIDLWTKDAGDAPRAEVEEVYADGQHTAALLHVSSGGLDTRQAYIFHLNRDGKVEELWGLPSDSTIADAFAAGNPVSEHPNVAPFLAAEEARQRSEFDEKDTAIIERFLADEVLWHMGGQSEWAAQEHPSTRDEVIGKFRMFKKATGGTLFFDIHHVFADDTHAASFVELTADRPDRPDKHMDVKEVNIFHLDSDGRAFEFWGIPTDEAVRDEFWAP